jgi:ParB-like chromosome segregation protein Spo0J
MPPAVRICDLEPAAIRVEDQIQPRVRLDPTLVEEYQTIYLEAAPDSAPFPPLTVFEIEGTCYVADGFHRLAAARAAGISQVRCQVVQGTLRDAMLYAMEANAHHGLRYSQGDKARIVERVLADAAIAALPDRDIARRFGLSHTYVSQVRKRHTAQEQLSADLATVATRARNPWNQETERLAGILHIPYAAAKAVARHDPGHLARLPKEIVRRVARGENYQAVKRELAQEVAHAAERATARAAQYREGRKKAQFYARRWRERQAESAYLALMAGPELEHRLNDLLSPDKLAILLVPLLPPDELPTAEQLGSLLFQLKKAVIVALHNVSSETDRLNTRPEGELVQALLALIREARTQGRDPEEMQRPYPSTIEDRDALNHLTHRHLN